MKPSSKIILGLLIFILALVALNLFAEDAREAFDAGLKSSADGHPEEAIHFYESIVQNHGVSGPVLYNLGNAYFKHGDVGKAILNYERALRLQPRDADIAANLHRAQTQAGVPLPRMRWWRGLIDFFTPNEWTWTASSLFFAFVLLIFVRSLMPGAIAPPATAPTGKVLGWRLAIAMAGVVCFLSVACTALSLERRHQAVVVVKEAQLLVSPFANARVMGKAPEGQTVDVEKQFGSFIWTRLSKTEAGWVEKAQLEPIEPDLFK